MIQQLKIPAILPGRNETSVAWLICQGYHKLLTLNGLENHSKIGGYSSAAASGKVLLAKTISFPQQKEMEQLVADALSLHEAWCSKLQTLLKRWATSPKTFA